jgi:hypothetical protein
MEKPIVREKLLLKKYPGKGGWTYADIPYVIPSKNTPFGWIIVKGTIDGIAIKKYHLMPSGNGNLFLPVKASIRKIINKEAGDMVDVVLYPDNETAEVPEEIILCLNDVPEARYFFDSLQENEKTAYIKWIYSVKSADKKAERIIKMIERLKKKQRFYDKTE